MWAFIYLVHNKCPRIPHYGIHIMVQSQLKYIYHRVDMGRDAHKHLLHYYVNPLKEEKKRTEMKLFIYVRIIDNKKSKWRNNNKKIVYGLTFRNFVALLLPFCFYSEKKDEQNLDFISMFFYANWVLSFSLYFVVGKDFSNFGKESKTFLFLLLMPLFFFIYFNTEELSHTRQSGIEKAPERENFSIEKKMFRCSVGETKVEFTLFSWLIR